MTALHVQPAQRPLTGRYRPPGDKSISHRAVLLAAVAEGVSEIRGWLDSSDTRATLAAVQALGASVESGDGGAFRITGATLRPPARPIDLGNSGTGLRLLAGIVAGQREWHGASAVLIGDASLSRRPMQRIIQPLEQMGARIASSNGCAPLTITARPLTGIEYRMPVASAQVKSAMLLAGLSADGPTVIEEPVRSRDHTERLLPAFGVTLIRDGQHVTLPGWQTLQATEVRVPGDISSAAFPLVAASLVSGSSVVVEHTGLNPTRDGIVKILQAMGGHLTIAPQAAVGEEPAGHIEVAGAALHGVDIPEAWVPAAIDEFPVVMAAAAAARGTTIIRGAAELRVKESDRLAVMCRNLARLGVAVEERDDGAIIHGGPVSGGEVDAAGDHRIAMSLAVLGLVAAAPVIIHGAEWIATSYPGFVDDLRALGAEVQWYDNDVS